MKSIKLIVLQVDPEAVRWSAILFCNRAAALIAQRNFSEAVSDCQSALSRDPGLIRAHLRRARAHAVE